MVSSFLDTLSTYHALKVDALLKDVEEFFGVSTPAPGVPVWDAVTGELFYLGKLARVYGGQASNCRLVLTAFQQRGWPQGLSAIDCKLRRHIKVSDVVDSLNGLSAPNRRRAKNTGKTPAPLNLLRFHAFDGGRSIRWSVL